jgi:hypothetical protein
MRTNGNLAAYVMADRMREAQAYRMAKMAKASERGNADRTGRLRGAVSAIAAAVSGTRRTASAPRPAPVVRQAAATA